MGITIHYKGKAKSLEAIDELIGELKKMAENYGLGCHLVEEEVKGELVPSWGYGFGFIPPKEQVEREGIEFFSKMVSGTCNGYFKIWEGKYADDFRKGFEKGRMPRLTINTRKKGIWLDIHPKCEALEFTFDLNTLELANYEEYVQRPGIIHGHDGFFCKTHYSGLTTHVLVAKIIKSTERYISYSSISDEGDFYHTWDIEKAGKAFGESCAELERIGEKLKAMGFKVIRGDEL